jgi:hypothetical protein
MPEAIAYLSLSRRFSVALAPRGLLAKRGEASKEQGWRMPSGIDSWNEARKQEAKESQVSIRRFMVRLLSRKNISKELEPRAPKIGNL